MWNSRSPGVEGAWCLPPVISTNGCSSAGRGPANKPVPRIGADRDDHRKAFGRVAKAYRADQPRDVRKRVVHGRLAVVVDRRHQEDRGRGQRRQNRLWRKMRAPSDPNIKIVGKDGEPCPQVHKGCASSSTPRRRRSTSARRSHSGCAMRASSKLFESDEWPTKGRFFVVRAGSLVAWHGNGEAAAPFRIVGAHTDSPNLRVKQHPDRFVSGWQVVALQPYGGAWLNSWLDRDLGVSGRLSVRSAGGVEHQLVRIDEPILRVPQLAIHLAEDRKAVSLDPQRHVNAVWGVGSGPRSFLGYVAEQAGVGRRRVLGFDLMTHDLTPSSLAGAGGELVSAPRLDNQATCYAGLEAFLAAEPTRLRAGARAVRPRGGRLAIGSRRAVRAAADGAGAHRAGRGRRPRGVPAPDAGIDGGVRRYGARHPSELPRAPRAGSPDRGQRGAGAQGAAEPALRHRRPHRRGVRAGVQRRPGCRCNATSTAPTCRADRRSGR